MPSRISATACGGGGVAVRRVDDLAAGEVDAVLGRRRRGSSPRGRPAPARSARRAAASIAPRSEVSSQGCATIVTAGVPSRAAAIRRSYFGRRVSVHGTSPRASGLRSRRRHAAPGRARRARRPGASRSAAGAVERAARLDHARGARRTPRGAPRPPRACSAGIAASAASSSTSSIRYCSRTSALNSASVMAAGSRHGRRAAG